MSEPEDLIAEGALHAAHVVRALWSRRSTESRSAQPTLAQFRRRLEILSAAVFPDAPEIIPAELAAPATLLARLARVAGRPNRATLSSTDGERTRLPRELDAASPSSALVRYQLLALEQAARAARGTQKETAGDPLARDLYLLCEAAAVDVLLMRRVPGLADALRDTRREALSERVPSTRACRAERDVEWLTCSLLRADPLDPPAWLPRATTPAESMAWARTEANRLRVQHGRYVSVAPVELWGTVAPPSDDVARHTSEAGTDNGAGPRRRSRALARRPRARVAQEGEDDSTPGTWIVRTDDPQEKAEDALGLQRPIDRKADADAGELADALCELPEVRIVRTPQRVHEVLVSENPVRRGASIEPTRMATGIAYPEWDWRVNAYRSRGAIVRPRAAAVGDSEWATEVLARHATLLRAVRRDFERLRSRCTALHRQPDGAELDVDAFVAAHAGARGAGLVDDRLYIDVRPRRRDLAIAVLVDTSASTDSWVAGDARVIDVEKEALIVVCEALRALGDPHTVLAFSGEGPGRVDIRELAELGAVPHVAALRARIAALEPDGFTRLGAAMRHATALLSQHAAHRHLLLVLSDGRPNDVDMYEGRYGVEDSRAAVAEAQLQGVQCFCLTVDRGAPRYATRIFGASRFAVLPRAERLPSILPDALRRLVRS